MHLDGSAATTTATAHFFELNPRKKMTEKKQWFQRRSDRAAIAH
jgi:hypothetical protein